MLCGYHRLFATAAIIAQPGIFARPRADREGGNGHKNEAAGNSPPLGISISALPLTDKGARLSGAAAAIPPRCCESLHSPTGAGLWFFVLFRPQPPDPPRGPLGGRC